MYKSNKTYLSIRAYVLTSKLVSVVSCKKDDSQLQYLWNYREM